MPHGSEPNEDFMSTYDTITLLISPDAGLFRCVCGCITQYYPDKAAQREVNQLIVVCPFKDMGCRWTGKVMEHDVSKPTSYLLPPPSYLLMELEMFL